MFYLWGCVICWNGCTVTYKHDSSCGWRCNNALKRGWVLSWWRLGSLSLCLHSSRMLLRWAMTHRFLTNHSQIFRVYTETMKGTIFSMCVLRRGWTIAQFKCAKADRHNAYFSHGSFNRDLTSRRNRGLSGMKTTPTSAARAGNRHTNINNLQLCIWNSVPMAKPHPGKSDSKQHVNISRIRVNSRQQSPSHFMTCLSFYFFLIEACILHTSIMHNVLLVI